MDKILEYDFSDALKEYVRKQKILVVHKIQTVRQVVRTGLESIDLPSNTIFVSNNMDEAYEYIEKEKPNVIVCGGNIGGTDFTELLERHLKAFPNRAQASFFVIERDNSPSAIVRAMAYEIEGVITEPITVVNFKMTFDKGLSEKINPTLSYIKLQEGKTLYRQGDSEGALLKLDEAAKEDPVIPNYEKAKILYYNELASNDEVCGLLETVLTKSPNHYKSLEFLGNIYIELKKYDKAFDLYDKLTSKFPINPDNLPNIIRTALYSKNYDEVISLYKFFSSIEFVSIEVSHSMAAGLCLAATHYLESGYEDLGLDAFKKAAKISNGHLNILKSIAKGLLSQDLSVEAEEILTFAKSTDTPEEEFEALMVEVYRSVYNYEQLLLYAHKVHRQGIYHPYIIKTIIELAKKLKKLAIIDEVFQVGIKKFPGRKEEFQKTIDAPLIEDDLIKAKAGEEEKSKETELGDDKASD